MIRSESELIADLDAASRNEQLSDGMLYREAAQVINNYRLQNSRYWHKIMSRTDGQAEEIVRLESALKGALFKISCLQKQIEMHSDLSEHRAQTIDKIRQRYESN